MRNVTTLVLAALVALVLSAPQAQAAFVSASLAQDAETLPDGRIKFVLKFIGNAGEAPVPGEYIADGGLTQAEAILAVEKYRDAMIARLNGSVTLSKVAVFRAGQVVPAAPAPTAPTAAEIAYQVWLVKSYKLERAKRLALTNATSVTDVTALETDVNSTYVAGYATK